MILQDLALDMLAKGTFSSTRDVLFRLVKSQSSPDGMGFKQLTCASSFSIVSCNSSMMFQELSRTAC